MKQLIPPLQTKTSLSSMYQMSKTESFIVCEMSKPHSYKQYLYFLISESFKILSLLITVLYFVLKQDFYSKASVPKARTWPAAYFIILHRII